MIAMNLYSGISLFCFVFCNDFEHPVSSEVTSTMIKICLQSSVSYFRTVMVCAWCYLCSHVLFFLCGYTIPFAIFIQHHKIPMQFFRVTFSLDSHEGYFFIANFIILLPILFVKHLRVS